MQPSPGASTTCRWQGGLSESAVPGCVREGRRAAECGPCRQSVDARTLAATAKEYFLRSRGSWYESSITAVNAQPNAPKSPNWFLISAPFCILILAWAIYRGSGPGPSPAAVDIPAMTDRTTEAVAPPSPIRRVAAHSDAPVAPPEAEGATNPETIGADVRQQRTELLEKLVQSNDATLGAVKSILESRGIRQPEAAASAWILAQNWAISARSESLAASKIQDANQLGELAEARRRILIQPLEAEIAGLAGTAPDARVFSELEAVGRGLKDSPAPVAGLMPNRSSGSSQRGGRRARAGLASEEE